MRGGAGHAPALSLLLAGLVLAAACQPAPPVARRRAAPSQPTRELSLCERPARSSSRTENAEVEASFRAFAQAWLEKRRDGVGGSRHFEIRGDFETELRATGNAQMPYVGTVRYCEHELHCPGLVPASCALSRRTVVSEIFRLEAGEWQY